MNSLPFAGHRIGRQLVCSDFTGSAAAHFLGNSVRRKAMGQSKSRAASSERRDRSLCNQYTESGESIQNALPIAMRMQDRFASRQFNRAARKFVRQGSTVHARLYLYYV